MNTRFIDINLTNEHARLWNGPYGWQIYPAGEQNQITHTKHWGNYVDHHVVLDIANLLNSRAREKPVLLDCGANIGNVAMGVRHYLKDRVEIHAFEAQKVLAQMITGSVALMSWQNVTVYNVAITDGQVNKIAVPLYDYSQEGQFGSVELGQSVAFKNSEGIGQPVLGYTSVEGRSIDSYGFPSVDLIKIDIEGMEMAALWGAKSTIDRSRPILHIEHHKSDHEAMKQLIKDWGYNILDENTGCDYICIPR